MKEDGSVLKILTGKPTGKRPLGRPRRKWEDNVRMNLKETANNTRNCVGLAQDKEYCRTLVNTALNIRVPFALELFIHNLKSRWTPINIRTKLLLAHQNRGKFTQ